MSESIAIFHYQPAERPFRSAFLILIAVALGFAVVAGTVVRAAISAESTITEPLPEYPARELAPEWRWERKPVEFEHMYRQKASTRVDWIRQGTR